jgi:hypothetical protein
VKDRILELEDKTEAQEKNRRIFSQTTQKL